jgi:uncharacterized oligopeptide transporter (OPT) family protein
MTLEQLIPVLQIALGPVILISGVGLLILSMTNRLGRTIDRSRELVELRRRAGDDERIRIELQLGILWRRARLLRTAITLSGVAVLLDSLLMILLFLGTLVKMRVAEVLALAFVGCMAALIGSILYFLRDINLALQALGHELQVETRNLP